VFLSIFVLCQARLADVGIVVYLSVRASVCSSVTKVMNTILWKQVNWLWCKLDRRATA